MSKKIVIIGAGPAGLSCAYWLKKFGFNPLIFEKESRPGGLLRTEKFGNYQFDYAGHLLHFQNPEIERWVKNIVGKSNLNKFKRKSFIYYKEKLLPYPFQVNTYGLPPQIVKECLLGFIEAGLKRKKRAKNFKEWILMNFGKGFANHFFFPFNEKFWKIPLDEIEIDWTDWSIPVPSLEDVIDGALGISKKDYGYNVWFYYPKQGGIEFFAQKLAEKVGKIFLNREIIAVHLKNKKILLDNKEEIEYDYLISTMPLRELILKMVDIPDNLKEMAKKLRYISVICLNLGAESPEFPEYHWIYFPEKKFVFYRAGFYANFSGKSSKYQSIVLEITHLPQNPVEKKSDFIKKSIKAFEKAGFLAKGKIDYIGMMKIPYAYVVYDEHRRKTLPKLFNFLKKNQIFSIGRYGGWRYSTTESALIEGKNLAEKLAKCECG